MKYDDFNLISHYHNDVNHALMNIFKHNESMTHLLMHTNSHLFSAYVHKSKSYIIIEYSNAPYHEIDFLLVDMYYNYIEVTPLHDVHDGMQTVHDLQTSRLNGLQ